MAEMQWTNLSSSLSNNKISTHNNGTGLFGKIYLFAPASSSTKLILLLILVAIGILAFVGNTLLLCFLKTKRKTSNFLKACCFEKNFNFYIKSLAISDVLSAVISLPALCIQMYVDLFQQGWGCRIIRYLNFVFPTITMNNLLVISIEKYFSTRKLPLTFSHSTVRKMVILAWLEGFLVVLIVSTTFKGTIIDLNDTHYTVICKYDTQYLPFRIIFLSYTILQYIIPSFLIIGVSVSLLITVWGRMKSAVDVQRDNAFTLARRAATIRCTCIIITLMFAFVLPYIFYFAQLTYNIVTKAHIDFQTDYVIRFGSGVIALANCAINVIIYLVQMKDFRAFVKKQFISGILQKLNSVWEVSAPEG